MTSAVVAGCFALSSFLNGMWLPWLFRGVDRVWAVRRRVEGWEPLRAPVWLHGLAVVPWGFVSFAVAEAILAPLR